VYVLIEHQSGEDPVMPLRLLYFVVLYWERQWRAWEHRGGPERTLPARPFSGTLFVLALCTSRRLDDLYQHPGQGLGCADGVMNPLAQSLPVRVVGESNDAGMVRKLSMEPMKMSAVVGQDGSAERHSVGQGVGVGDFPVCPARRKSGQHVVAKGAKNVHQRERHVFVREERSHGRLVFLVFPDGLVNFLTLPGVIIPGGSKLGLGQWLFVLIANFVVCHTHVACLDEHPNGDTTIADAGVAANDAWSFADYCREGGLAVFGHGRSSSGFSGYNTIVPIFPSGCARPGAR
jgi:hypothetical protein